MSEQLRSRDALDATIRERQTYYREQEKKIKELIEWGNDELMMLTHEVALAKKERDAYRTEVRTLRRDKQQLLDDIARLQVQAMALDPFAAA